MFNHLGSQNCAMKIFLCFSLKTNIKKLFNTDIGNENYRVINGVRTFGVGLIIVGHTGFYTGIWLGKYIQIPRILTVFISMILSTHK